MNRKLIAITVIIFLAGLLFTPALMKIASTGKVDRSPVSVDKPLRDCKPWVECS